MINEDLKRHIISGAITFVSTFLSTFGVILLAVPAESWTSTTYVSIIAGVALSAVRAAIKVAVESITNQN